MAEALSSATSPLLCLMPRGMGSEGVRGEEEEKRQRREPRESQERAKREPEPRREVKRREREERDERAKSQSQGPEPTKKNRKGKKKIGAKSPKAEARSNPPPQGRVGPRHPTPRGQKTDPLSLLLFDFF